MTKSENKERENHILAEAAELFIHFGYDKTTINDIARETGISVGTVYLHFEGKEQLLEEVIIRELSIYAEKWLELLDADPNGGTIGSMYKNILYALDSSPFMSGIFRQDGRIFGSYMRKKDNFFRKQDQSSRFNFVKLMQDAGAIRQDIDASVIAHVMDMIAYGLVAMDEVKDRKNIPPMNALIEGIAMMMDAGLKPEGGVNQTAGKAIIKQISDAARQQLADRH